MQDPARLAARNNAEWCDAVSLAHGARGQFEAGFWVNPGQAPPYYPNLVTLDPGDGDAQRAEIIALAARPGGFGAKDSFAALDLADIGLSIAFSADWLWLDAAAPMSASSLTTRIVNDATALAGWERAWGGDPDAAPVFPPALLADDRIAFIAVETADAAVAGAALNRSETVVGLSNMFTLPGTDPGDALRAIVGAARARHPGRPIVGYEHGPSLAFFLNAGFQAAGPLRVWVR